MLHRILISILCLLTLSFTNSAAQIMHIHMGEEEREFNLADVDSITYADSVLNLSVEPEAIDFRGVIVRDVQEAILTVNNTGNGELTITSIDLEEGAFSVLFEDQVFIAPENSFEFTVSFSPQEVGDFESEIIIHSNSPLNPEVTVPLSGSGTEGFNWDFTQTDISMSVLVMSALIGDESLCEDDAIGVFTPDGQCAGFAIVPDRFPDDGVGIAVWGADRGMDNGFQDGEQLIFKFWDSDAQQEYLTDFEIIVGDWAFFSPNAFLIISLTARE